MAFRTIAELVELSAKENKPISQIMIDVESEVSGKSRQEIIKMMTRNLDIMEEAVRRGIAEPARSRSGLTGGDAVLLQTYLKEREPLSGRLLLDAVSKSVATNEVNAKMGTICATPTAGACGIVPGTLFAVAPKLNASHDQMVNYLFTAGAIGFVIANNAFISGAAGGCQAEVGSATAMAAAAIVEMAGGSAEQSSQAVAIALKNMLGLVCDPVAGLVEVPCVKRNAMGAANAMVAADMALAGIKSAIPTDEVIDAMYRIGCAMPNTLKETALGGLAATPTGRELERRIFGE
ncbi:L-serine ammonia-lyase, iron-sulfur-dependent, subunit alpha [Aneurinibacillus danicus]|jgi:L-serine dehydratase|uniref:L-serine dehydratase n=2 Tax=Aneurinibacillus TaxID=55079 RepID=A0A511VD40_9BACL|nr:L-serine ammonia-lyase, iron-sulfur-dependent, subunit alpha [Aneurinibacillus danicus]GEN35858.1 putative L-serine dehydratase, alpha chain [Aneurinibacillus danicus]